MDEDLVISSVWDFLDEDGNPHTWEEVASGERNWYEKNSHRYPSRADFICWLYIQNQPKRKRDK